MGRLDHVDTFCVTSPMGGTRKPSADDARRRLICSALADDSSTSKEMPRGVWAPGERRLRDGGGQTTEPPRHHVTLALTRESTRGASPSPTSGGSRSASTARRSRGRRTTPAIPGRRPRRRPRLAGSVSGDGSTPPECSSGPIGYEVPDATTGLDVDPLSTRGSRGRARPRASEATPCSRGVREMRGRRVLRIRAGVEGVAARRRAPRATGLAIDRLYTDDGCPGRLGNGLARCAKGRNPSTIEFHYRGPCRAARTAPSHSRSTDRSRLSGKHRMPRALGPVASGVLRISAYCASRSVSSRATSSSSACSAPSPSALSVTTVP